MTCPRDQGCPADVWSSDTTRDAHRGLRRSGARAAPLAGGKCTLNLMKLQGVVCSAVPPTAVPAALPATGPALVDVIWAGESGRVLG